MRKLLPLLFSLVGGSLLAANTSVVTGPLSDISAVAYNTTGVEFWPLSTPLANGSTMVIGPMKSKQPASGNFSITLVCGYYKVYFRPTTNSINIWVPCDGSTNTLAVLATNSASIANVDVSPMYKVKISSADTNQNYLSGKVLPGTSVTITTNATTGTLTLNSTAAGGGSATNVYQVAAGTNIVVLTNGLLYTIHGTATGSSFDTTASNTYNGTFTGNGAGLTNISAASVPVALTNNETRNLQFNGSVTISNNLVVSDTVTLHEKLIIPEFNLNYATPNSFVAWAPDGVLFRTRNAATLTNLQWYNFVSNDIPANVALTGTPLEGQLARVAANNTLVGSFDGGSFTNLSGLASSVTNWITGLVGSVNQHFYFSSVTQSFGVTVATNCFTMIDSPVAAAATNSQASSALVAGQYWLSRVSTNTISRVESGPIELETYITITGGGSMTAHPEIHLWLPNDTLQEVAVAPDLTYSGTAVQRVNVSMNVATSTNCPAGTRLMLRWKYASSSGLPTWNFIIGGVYDSHISVNVANQNGVYTGTFTGDGSGLTALNAGSLASGTVPYLRAGSFTNHDDVTITSLAAGHSIAYSGTAWTNGPSGGVGSQTPWTSDINAGGYSLTNVANIQINGTSNGMLTLWDADQTKHASVRAPTTITSNSSWTLPLVPATGLVYGTNHNITNVTLSQIASGSAGQILTMVGGIPAFATPAESSSSSAMSLPRVKRWSYATWNGGSSWLVAGDATPTHNGVGQVAVLPTGTWDGGVYSYSSGAGTGVLGWNAVNPLFYFARAITMDVHGQFMTTNDIRFWAGLFSLATSALNSDNPASASLASFWISTNTATWWTVTKDQTTPTYYNTGVALTTDPVTLRVVYTPSVSAVFYINGVSVATNTTTLPLTTDRASWVFRGQELAAATKTNRMAWVYVEQTNP